jgi:N-acetylneuraminic acid mutarotase
MICTSPPPLPRIDDFLHNCRCVLGLSAIAQSSRRTLKRHGLGAGVIAAAVLPATLCCTTLLAADGYAPQRQASLQQMLKITWKKGPDLPQGLQDSSGGIINGRLTSVAGFGQGQKDVPGKPDKYPRGFLKKTWGLDLSQPDAGWAADMPEFPGAARQGLFCAAVNEKLYCWGGINYTKPFTYKDGYRLSKQDGHWVWDPLPDFPRPAAWPGICAVGSRIYVLGGADYDSETFYTHADRAGKNERLGAQFLMIDTADLMSGWKRLADCPGTPRMTPALAAVDGKIFLIGGASGDDVAAHPIYTTVVDNWKYDPTTNQWERLRDLPVASGNFPSGKNVYENRYIILIGGYQYPLVENVDGSVRKPYGVPYKHYKFREYFSDVWVYDTQSGLFGTATPLPLNNNTPMTVLDGSSLYLIGGETGGSVIEGESFGHHPDLFLVGTIEKTK